MRQRKWGINDLPLGCSALSLLPAGAFQKSYSGTHPPEAWPASLQAGKAFGCDANSRSQRAIIASEHQDEKTSDHLIFQVPQPI